MALELAPSPDSRSCFSEAPVMSSLSSLQSNIIDVSAADSQGMEQHEYMDRARQYRSAWGGKAVQVSMGPAS